MTTSTLITLAPAELQDLVERAAERGAAKALAAAAADQSFGTLELEKLLNKRGSALREWLRRHPSFPRRRVGRKLVFDRAAVDRWLAEHRPACASASRP